MVPLASNELLGCPLSKPRNLVRWFVSQRVPLIAPPKCGQRRSIQPPQKALAKRSFQTSTDFSSGLRPPKATQRLVLCCSFEASSQVTDNWVKRNEYPDKKSTSEQCEHEPQRPPDPFRVSSSFEPNVGYRLQSWRHTARPKIRQQDSARENCQQHE